MIHCRGEGNEILPDNELALFFPKPFLLHVLILKFIVVSEWVICDIIGTWIRMRIWRNNKYWSKTYHNRHIVDYDAYVTVLSGLLWLLWCQYRYMNEILPLWLQCRFYLELLNLPLLYSEISSPLLLIALSLPFHCPSLFLPHH